MVEYRQLQESELEEAIKLAIDVFEDTSDPEDFTAEYAQNEFPLAFTDNYIRPIIYVGVDGNKVVALSVIYKHASTPYNFQLTWVVTHPDYRKQGLGRGIISYIEEEIKKMLNGKPGSMSFTSFPHNHGFYEKLGFKVGSKIHNTNHWLTKTYNEKA